MRRQLHIGIVEMAYIISERVRRTCWIIRNRVRRDAFGAGMSCDTFPARAMRSPFRESVTDLVSESRRSGLISQEFTQREYVGRLG